MVPKGYQSPFSFPYPREMSSPLYEEKEKIIMFETILRTVLTILVGWVTIHNLVVMIHNDNVLVKKLEREGVKY